MNTVALVGLDGSIDYMCFPDFDSPSIFAALLDDEKGGCFSVRPVSENCNNKQLYLPDTNVLLTRFLCPEGVAEVTDFMPLAKDCEANAVVRRVSCVRGEMRFIVCCKPRFNYAQSDHAIEVLENEVIFRSKGEDGTAIRLKSNIPLNIVDQDVVSEFMLHDGEEVDFILEVVDNEESSKMNLAAYVEDKLYATINYWKRWMSRSTYRGRWMDEVNRSAMVLKLLTSRKHGSMVAAPTFSLPEGIGGIRNWDYRYTWIRDASFTIYALLSLGYRKEAAHFISWVEKKCQVSIISCIHA